MSDTSEQEKVSGAVTTTRQAAEFDHALARNGWTADDVKWLSTGTTLTEVLKLRKGTHVIVPISMVSGFVLEIDHSLTREQLREAIACDWVDPSFTETNVPLSTEAKKETVAVELLWLGRNVSDDDATEEAKKRGYRRATPRETLTLGAKHPDLQRQFPIVAAPTGGRVLYLGRFDAERDLCVRRVGSGWHGVCRFAVVREQLKP